MEDINGDDKTQQRFEKLKRIRAGKKGSITKRVNTLLRLVSEGGSRTKIKYLLSAMLEVYKATKEVCEELSALTIDLEEEWIEEVSITVDECVAEVQEYIEARKDDQLSSTASYTESWLKQHASDIPSQSDMSNLISSIADISIHENKNSAMHRAPAGGILEERESNVHDHPLSASTKPPPGFFATLGESLTVSDPSLQINREARTDPNIHEIGTSHLLFSSCMSPAVGSFVTSSEPAVVINPMSTSVNQAPYENDFVAHDHSGQIQSSNWDPTTADCFTTSVGPSVRYRLSNPGNKDLGAYESIAPRSYTIKDTTPVNGPFSAAESSRGCMNYEGTSYHLGSTNRLQGTNTQGAQLHLCSDWDSTVGSFATTRRTAHATTGLYTSLSHVEPVSILQTRPRAVLDAHCRRVDAPNVTVEPTLPADITRPAPQPSLQQPMHCFSSNPTIAMVSSDAHHYSYPGISNTCSGSIPASAVSANKVDSWIDELDEVRANQTSNIATSGITPDITMAWLVQQSLPRIQIPAFDGSPTLWVEFVTKFRDLVHNQGYLTDTQRSTYLLQHLKGEAKRAVKGSANDGRGYVLALKKLKFLFGQKSKIAQATIMQVTQGKVIQCDDHEGLQEYYYTVSDCLVTLRQLNYASDLYSSDTLRQAVRRLPSNLLRRWAEYSLVIRERSEEPNLVHFESWLQKRVLAQKESYLPQHPRIKKKYPREERNERDHLVGSTLTGAVSCPSCGKKHLFWKCEKYKRLSPAKRFEQVKKMKYCHNCLTKNHPTPKCPSRNTCFVSGCNQRHHTTLHEHFMNTKDTDVEKSGTEKRKDQDARKNNSEGSKSSPFNGLVKSAPKDVYLQIVPVTLHSAGEALDTYALLDSGSQITLIRADVAKKLSLKGERRIINVTTIKDEAERLEVQDVSLKVSSRDEEQCFQVESAYAVPAGKFNMPAQRCPANCHDIYTHLDGIELDAVNPEDITILIGANVPEALLPIEVRRGKDDQPLAIKTKFGWTLFGTSPASDHSICHSSIGLLHTSTTQIEGMLEQFWMPCSRDVTCNVLHLSDDALQQSLEKFWVQEHCAILPARDTGMSREDHAAMEKLHTCTKFTHGRYEVPMLWKECATSLPNNFRQARRRLEFLLKRLRADPELHRKYKETITGYVGKGYARRMSTEEGKTMNSKTWYLPHHPVFNPNKPGKLRVVFDAAAKCEGKSLNESLVTGPDLLNSLVGVLIRFRTGRIAFAADIEAMFHQVMVNKTDADSLRFLWTDDIFSNDPPYTMQMLVHIFGAKDSPTCANYALQATARDNYQQFDGSTYESVLKSFYVDDLLKSVPSEDIAVSLAKELVEISRCGGFRLTKFLSNNKRVTDLLPSSEVSPSMAFELDSEHLERTLGVCWQINLDDFTFKSNLKQAPMTKRGILQIVSSVFDPLGFITPFTLNAKLLLQDLWRQNCEWDEEVNAETQTFWKKWLEGAKGISSIRLSRCYNLNEEIVSEVQLHTFCDASESAFGPVAYLRFSFKGGGHQCSLVMSKSKLAPIKAVTLPRLELNAAVAAVRLYRRLIHEIDLPIVRAFFWSDSTLTLQYITNKSQRFKVYVTNRVTEILEATEAGQWNYVPGIQNPADLVTRGVSDPSKLMKADKHGTSWFSGPAFLQQDEDCWPTMPAIGDLDEDDPELKRKQVLIAFIMKKEIIDTARFSSWTRLRRSLAWALRFLHNCKTKEVEKRLSDILACEEINAAEHLLVSQMQQVVFSDEIELLKKEEPLPKHHKLSSLCPFVDESGTLRVGGRLKNAPIPSASKHQIILQKDHPITNMIIRHEHSSNGHVGAEHVLANLREIWWIVNGRTAIKTVLRKCFFCRVKRARRIYPFMADLPEGRMAYDEPPFTNCGVDLFGPLFIKQGRKRLKRWAVLFTCLTIRCIHLEVVESADTDAFINTLRRFTNRRGCPKTFYSDCGTNFKGATNELKEVIQELKHNEEDIQEFAIGKNITWKYNPPSAPHMGGAWERLVRSVKEVMTAIMKDKVLTDPQLATLLTEVENILNTRPLTPASEDVDDLEALTPYHIILGRHRNWCYMGEIRDTDISSRRKWKQVQALRNIFWRRWRREYLPQLTKRATWTDSSVNYKVGELVLLADDDTRRGKWPLARITKIMPGKDDIVRVVEVRTKDGIYTRPVVKLCKLEDENEVPQGEGHVTVADDV